MSTTLNTNISGSMSTIQPKLTSPKTTIVDDDSFPNSDLPIVQLIFINPKPSLYVGAAGASPSDTKKGKANFHPLESENLCEGVELTIPLKVVEAMLTGIRCVSAKETWTDLVHSFEGPSAMLYARLWELHVSTLNFEGPSAMLYARLWELHVSTLNSHMACHMSRAVQAYELEVNVA
ncbi:hypothetical protein Tco_1252782 [Tanacetum coccineum]